jgi:Tfp pilus assembly protein PilN
MTPELRRLTAFGTGAGIHVNGADLEIAVARVRPTGIKVLGHTTIPRFRERPAASWGIEYNAFLGKLGARHLSATVVLPREETIVRQIMLKGVNAADQEAAIAFQMDTLNPYGGEEVLFGWTPLGEGAVLVGVVRREILQHYLELFNTASIPIASCTFAAAAIRAAIRMGPPPPPGFLALSRSPEGRVEVYGESPARPAFSAEFELPVERAASLAVSELRLPPETTPVNLSELLPAPRVNPVSNDLTRNALPYAAALAGACPWLSPMANLLPAEQRVSNSRAWFIPTAALAALLIMLLGASLAWSSFEQRQYLNRLEDQIAHLEPRARLVASLDRQIAHKRGNARLLDQFRSRTRADLETLNELSRLLPPPVWTNLVELSPDTVVINGEAEQAAPLLKVVDGSPLFHNSEFNGISKMGNAELFRLLVQRRPRQ